MSRAEIYENCQEIKAVKKKLEAMHDRQLVRHKQILFDHDLAEKERDSLSKKLDLIMKHLGIEGTK